MIGWMIAIGSVTLGGTARGNESEIATENGIGTGSVNGGREITNGIATGTMIAIETTTDEGDERWVFKILF